MSTAYVMKFTIQSVRQNVRFRRSQRGKGNKQDALKYFAKVSKQIQQFGCRNVNNQKRFSSYFICVLMLSFVSSFNFPKTSDGIKIRVFIYKVNIEEVLNCSFFVPVVQMTVLLQKALYKLLYEIIVLTNNNMYIIICLRICL